jgi:hypothetical protein
MRRRLVIALALVTGCRSAPKSDAGAPPAPSAKPAPSVAAVDAGAPAPPAFPTPQTPPGADPEHVLFASSICAAATLQLPLSPKTTTVGCRSHAPFERPEQQPDGKLPVFTGDPLAFCAISKVYRGSFTRPGATQAIVAFDACKHGEDDPSWDMGNPGDAVVVEQVEGRWRSVGYVPDVNAGACVAAHRADGRDVLLCKSGLGAGPSGEVVYVFLLDVARKDQQAGTVALIHGDTLACAWVEPSGYRIEGGLTSTRISGMSLEDRNGDGTPDLLVDVDRVHAPPSPALDAKVRAACAKDPNVGEKALLPAPKRTRLEILSTGDRFAPSPASQKILDAWAAEAPPNMNGLEGAAPRPLR